METERLILLQLFTDLSFMKQSLIYLLKDTNETDRLLDQCFTALSSRCCGSSTNELLESLDAIATGTHLQRAIGEAILSLSKRCLAFQR